MINQDSRSEEQSLDDELELLRQQDGVGAAATPRALVAQTQGGAVSKGAVGGRPRISRELIGLTRADPTSPFKLNLGGASMTAVVGSRADQAGGRMSTRQSSAQGMRSHSEEGRRGSRSLSAEARSRGGC